MEITTSVENHNPKLSGIIRAAMMIETMIITAVTVAAVTANTYDMGQVLF